MNKVTFLSEDGHKFLFETDEKDESIAIKKGEEKLKELNYDNYGYSFYSIESINES